MANSPASAVCNKTRPHYRQSSSPSPSPPASSQREAAAWATAAGELAVATAAAAGDLASPLNIRQHPPTLSFLAVGKPPTLVCSDDCYLAPHDSQHMPVQKQKQGFGTASVRRVACPSICSSRSRPGAVSPSTSSHDLVSHRGASHVSHMPAQT